MYIMGMISIHIWGYTIKKSTYTIINIYYKCYQHIVRFNVKFFFEKYIKGILKV
jgi:hypothetical protein